MANGIRTGNLRGFNKERRSKVREASRFRQTPEEGQSTYRPKCCGYTYKDEDNSPKTIKDKKKNLEREMGTESRVGLFQERNRGDHAQEDLDMVRKRKFKGKTESLLRAV